MLLFHCRLHGRRQFAAEVENFPEQCRKVIESPRQVYRFEALAKKPHLADLDWLAWHTAHSQPVLDEIQTWMQDAGADRAKAGRIKIEFGIRHPIHSSSDGKP